MEKEKLAELLIELYKDYQNAIIDAEKSHKRHYDDIDFNSLESFMRFIETNCIY